MKRKKKTLPLLILGMITYILWVFYISEPKYINNLQDKKLEVYDYVSICERCNEYDYHQMKNGIVLQVDNEFALLMVKQYKDTYFQLNLKDKDYRVIGRGTIYHKVNQYVGFNIMLITQICISVLTAIFIIITFYNLMKTL